MQNKFNMTREESVFFAKRMIVDSIWKEAKLEGLAVTYPDTQAIFDGLAPNGLRLSEIIAVNNLKYGWRFLLDNLDVPIDLPYVCQINKLLGGDNLILRAGLLRTTSVSIGGTTWKPEIPNPEQVRIDLENIQSLPTATEQAITLMLYLMRSQLFLDGNKRTAQLCANQIMISAGCGIITIPIEQQSHFLNMLIDFYETNNQDKIAQFVYDYCIDGIEFNIKNYFTDFDGEHIPVEIDWGEPQGKEIW